MIDPFVTEGVPFFKDKKVVVTGASGLIGSYAVKLLVESGAVVKAVVHARPANAYTLRAPAVVERDLHEPRDVRAAVGDCDAVINCAGITGGVNLPTRDPVSYVGPATALVINVLHACHELKIPHFGYLSSTTVYAPSDTPVQEDDVNKPDALYPLYRGIGHSKRFCEQLCRYYSETTGINVGVIRPAGAYGRFDNFDPMTSHVLPGLVQRALTLGDADTFEVWGDGKDVRDFIHAQDVARCLLLATAAAAAPDAPAALPINAASGAGVTTAELAQMVLDAVGSKARIVFRPDKPSALRTRLVDVTRARRVLGFEAQIALADGIRDTVAWVRDQGAT